MIRVNFAPKNEKWFRFRNATVEIEMEEEKPKDAKKRMGLLSWFLM